MAAYTGFSCSAVNMIKKVNLALGNIDLDDGVTAFEAINNGDLRAMAVFKHYCRNVAIMILNIQTVINGSKVVIGGGISAQPILIEEVTFVSTESFHLKTVDVLFEGRNVRCDIAYGGNFYGIIRAEDLGLSLDIANSEGIVAAAMELRDVINSEHDVRHPEYPFINKLTHMELYEEGEVVRNTVVVPPGGIDRSPCGTGTCAKVATLYKEGRISENDLFIHESITGSQFKARLISSKEENGITFNKVSITGSAWIMARHDFYMNESDPLQNGYLLIPDI